MRNLVTCLMQLGQHLLQHLSHRLLPVQHGAGLLVALDEVSYAALKLLVDLLVLQDADHAPIDIGIEEVMLSDRIVVFLGQGLLLDVSLLDFALTLPQYLFFVLQFVSQLLILCDGSFKVHHDVPEIRLRLYALLVQLIGLLLQFLSLLLQSVQFLVG